MGQVTLITDEEKKRKLKGYIMGLTVARTEIARVKTAYFIMKELGVTGCKGIQKVEYHKKSPAELEVKITCRVFDVIVNYDIVQNNVSWMLELRTF